jgi:hypothetical protein
VVQRLKIKVYDEFKGKPEGFAKMEKLMNVKGRRLD